MNFEINKVIAHIRRTCPAFEQRVAGAVEYAADSLRSEEAPDYPCAYVVLSSEQADDNEGQNEYSQSVTVSFSVIVFVANSNTEERRGQLLNDQIGLLRPQIFKSLLRYTPDEDYFDPFSFEGGSVLYMDAERMIYSFDFSTSYRLAYEDTWQEEEQRDLPKFNEADVTLEDKIFETNGIFKVGEK